MPDDEPRVRQGDYRAARIGSAVALTVAVCFIVVLDALDPAREANPIILAALLGTVVTLLGIEARNLVGGK